MPEPTFSVIIPTIGRASLAETLKSIAGQAAHPLDGGWLENEVVVISDGPRSGAAWLCDMFNRSSGFALASYEFTPPSRDWGATQRNLGMSRAKNDYLLFIDDDDIFVPLAFQTICRRIAQRPGQPLMFRMEHHIVGTIWREPAVIHRNVGTGMLVLPNDKGRIGRYSARYEGDFDFFTETEPLWPGGFVWLEDVIVACRKTWAQAGGEA